MRRHDINKHISPTHSLWLGIAKIQPVRRAFVAGFAVFLIPTNGRSQIFSGVIPWAAGILILLVVAILVFLNRQRLRRRGPSHHTTGAVPYLQSPDESLFFYLDKLDEDGLIIGRGKRGVHLRIEASTPNADTVSNRHARVYYSAAFDKVIIEDLGSTNGMFINGRQAPRKNLLRDGWEVGLGRVILVYHDGESDTGPLT